jgi:hypothetical protein
MNILDNKNITDRRVLVMVTVGSDVTILRKVGWVVMPCELGDTEQRFRETYCIHLQNEKLVISSSEHATE